jgi:hypothetical protein
MFHEKSYYRKIMASFFYHQGLSVQPQQLQANLNWCDGLFKHDALSYRYLHVNK